MAYISGNHAGALNLEVPPDDLDLVTFEDQTTSRKAQAS